MRDVVKLAFFALLLSCCPAGHSADATTGPGQLPPDQRPPISVPSTVAMEMEAAAIEKALTNQLQIASHPPQVAASRSSSQVNILLGIAIALAGMFAVRKLAPRFGELLNRRCNPWAEAADTGAEESSFTEFARSFTAGPGELARPLSAAISSAPETPWQTLKQEPESNSDPMGDFLANSSKDLAAIRKLVSELGRDLEPAVKHHTIGELLNRTGSLKAMANLPSVLPAWQMASALEGLLKQLADKPAQANPSTVRTVACAVDLLHALCNRGLKPSLATEPPARLLAVDDDPISRHALSFSLKKVFTQPDLAADGESALLLAEEQAYDVIFLDVQMPRMDGFELCSRIHGTVLNQTTPVVFVTCHSDFNARAKSTLTGGQDLLAKPFLTFELTVKALTLVLRRRLQSGAPSAQSRRSPKLAMARQLGVASAGIRDLNVAPQIDSGVAANADALAH